jgi:hypothetical protein
MAWSDQPWILEGAAVRVSLIGFDNGTEKSRTLDGIPRKTINTDLTATTDLSVAETLIENTNLSFQAVLFRGSFDIPISIARKMLADSSANPHDRPNSDVIKPRYNAVDVTRRSANMYVVDFGIDTPQEEAAKYVLPFQHVREHVYPERQKANQQKAREEWWLHWRPRPAMKEAMKDLSRYIATPAVAKHRLFVWLDMEIVPTHALITFARDDDYFFGVLHSGPHELWALRMGTWLGAGNDPRYTPTTTFETFPFPWLPGQEPGESEDERVYAIAEVARRLVAFRQAWLNPPEEHIDAIIPSRIIKKLTLTNLYNALNLYRDEYKGRIRDRMQWNKVVDGIITLEQVEELDYIHTALDTAVLDAYGWPHTLTDEQILERLLVLNLERAAGD